MAQSNNGGPPCPKPSRVRELIDVIGDSTISGSLKNEHDLIDALDWLATMLENRSTYHKRQQLKNKIVRQLAKEHGLDVQANLLTNDALHDFVSSQPPSGDEINLDIHNPGDNDEES